MKVKFSKEGLRKTFVALLADEKAGKSTGTLDRFLHRCAVGLNAQDLELWLKGVKDRLPEHEPFDNFEKDLVELYNDGFTVQDAASYMNCREEINPDLSEDFALRRMHSIRARYPDSVKGGMVR